MRKPLLIFPVLLMLAEMVAYLSNDMYLPALAEIMQNLKLSTAEVQLTLTAWFLGATSIQLLIGPLSDRIGRRPILILGMALFVLSTLFCMLVSNLPLFLFARYIQGSTVCFIVVAGYASIHELFDQRNAIHLLVRMNSIIVLAPAFGPFVGGLILLVASWRSIFGFLLFLGISILLALYRWMPEPLPSNKRNPLKMAILFKQYKAILSNRHFMLLVIPYSLIFCGFIAWLVAGPFYVITEFHHQPTYFGILQVIIFGFYILGNTRVKQLMESIGVTKLVEAGLGIAFLGGLVSYLLALFAPEFLSGLIVGMALFSLGFGLSSAPLQRLAIEASPEPMGSRMAIVSSFLGISGLLATLLVSLLYDGHLLALAYILLGTSSLAALLYTS